MNRRRRLHLPGTVAMITGGAGGIGYAIAARLAARGAIPVLVDLKAADPVAAAHRLGPPATGVAADVTDLAELEAATTRIAEQHGGIDLVVANAGIGPVATTVDAGDRDHQRRVLQVNLLGVWHTAWAATPHLRHRRGHLVVVSSAAAFLPGPGQAAYAASKAAVEHLARAMRVELAGTGTTVAVAHFGYVDTPLMSNAFQADPLGARMAAKAPSFITRPAPPDDVARALVHDIERRTPRTLYPRWWWAPYLLRGVTGPAADWWAARSPDIATLMTDIRDRDATRERLP
jgi:NAD(P)-dependent dehydrogenase (short-subunit alcohol dehydrogenase family)